MDEDQKLKYVQYRDRNIEELEIIKAIIEKRLKIYNRSLVDIYSDMEKLGLKKEYFKKLRLIDLAPSSISDRERKIMFYTSKAGKNLK